MIESSEIIALRERLAVAERKAENLANALRVADEENIVLRAKIEAIRKLMEDAP